MMSKARLYAGLTLHIVSMLFRIMPSYALAYVKYSSFRSNMVRELTDSGMPREAASALAGEYSPKALLGNFR